MTPNATTATKALAGVVFIVSVCAFVYLDTHGGDTAGLMVLVGPVVAAMYVTAAAGERLGTIHRAVQTVERQTNGVMDERIRTQTKAALLEVLPDLTAAAAAVTPPAPAPSPGSAPSTSTMAGFTVPR